jgi:hypothetical protein
MKKIFVLVGLIALFSSCILPMGEDMMKDPTMKFMSLDACGNWIANNICYDASGTYEWQSPYQTMERRSGICVDFCSLLLWYAVEEFGADKMYTYMLKVTTKKGTLHAICVINGMMIEPQTYEMVSPDMYAEIVEKVSYEELFNTIFYQYHNRSVVQ